MSKILAFKSGKEMPWYEDVGYSAPASGLISKDLEKLNIEANSL